LLRYAAAWSIDHAWLHAPHTADQVRGSKEMIGASGRFVVAQLGHLSAC
jgi:hypothetical protein